jgi:hypothetical protein
MVGIDARDGVFCGESFTPGAVARNHSAQAGPREPLEGTRMNAGNPAGTGETDAEGRAGQGSVPSRKADHRPVRGR